MSSPHLTVSPVCHKAGCYATCTIRPQLCNSTATSHDILACDVCQHRQRIESSTASVALLASAGAVDIHSSSGALASFLLRICSGTAVFANESSQPPPGAPPPSLHRDPSRWRKIAFRHQNFQNLSPTPTNCIPPSVLCLDSIRLSCLLPRWV